MRWCAEGKMRVDFTEANRDRERSKRDLLA
jgi:hypothetical protein